MTDPAGAVDPARHLLSRGQYRRQPDGTDVKLPVSLAEAEAGWRRMVEADAEQRLRLRLEYPEYESTDTVAITTSLAQGLVAILEEFAERVRPGRAVGPIQIDESLEQLLLGVATDLRALA